MTTHYIPADDLGKVRWLINFNTWFQAHGTAHGFSPAQIAEVTAKTNAFATATTELKKAKAAAQGATQKKNRTRNEALTLSRACAQQLQRTPTLTDSERSAAGLTIPDTTPTATNPDTILTIEAPLLLLDFSQRHQITIHWGPNPSNERRNGRPAGTIGCQIQMARGGIPSKESDWVILDTDKRSPLIHKPDETTPTTFTYRARYLGKDLNHGPFGATATCTVNM